MHLVNNFNITAVEGLSEQLSFSIEDGHFLKWSHFSTVPHWVSSIFRQNSMLNCSFKRVSLQNMTSHQYIYKQSSWLLTMEILQSIGVVCFCGLIPTDHIYLFLMRSLNQLAHSNCRFDTFWIDLELLILIA